MLISILATSDKTKTIYTVNKDIIHMRYIRKNFWGYDPHSWPGVPVTTEVDKEKIKKVFKRN